VGLGRNPCGGTPSQIARGPKPIRQLCRTPIGFAIGFLTAMLPVLGATEGQAAASPSAPSMAPAPVLSLYENPSRSVTRDDGLSVALPNGSDLWIFGDTAVYNNDGSGKMVVSAFIPGGTAAEGPYATGQVPTSLTEVPNPGRPLSPSAGNPPGAYMPTPTDVYLPDGSGGRCTPAPGRYPARWPSGAALIPSTSDVLLTYVDVCVTGSFQFDVEGWGFMEYNWRTNGLDLGPDDVFPPSPSGATLSPERQLGSPVINDGRVDLFSSNCTVLYVSCLAGQTYFTTVLDTAPALSNPASYHVEPAVTDGSAIWQPAGIAVAKYPDAPLRMIEMTGIAGTYDVLTATTPAGPWHLEMLGTVPGCQDLHSGFCYALMGHPELSNQSQLMISYYDPGAGPVGHMVAAATSYGPTAVGAGPTRLPKFGAPNSHPTGPPRPLRNGPPAGQAVSSTPCCVAASGGAVDPETTRSIQDGLPQGQASQGLNNAYQGDRPPRLVSTVRLDQERLISRDRVLKLVLEGLSLCLIVESLRRRRAIIARKGAPLDLSIPITRTPWRRRS
jgi:hypothetical protein